MLAPRHVFPLLRVGLLPRRLGLYLEVLHHAAAGGPHRRPVAHPRLAQTDWVAGLRAKDPAVLASHDPVVADEEA